MLSYGYPLMGSVSRSVFYNGTLWIHVIQAGGIWSDDMRTHHWTNAVQGFYGRPINAFKGGIWKCSR